MPPIRRFTGSLVSRLYNVQRVTDGAYRSAQIYHRHLPLILDYYQIGTLLNLRGKHPNSTWFKNEQSVCESKGVLHLNVILNSRWIPRQNDLIELFEAFKTAPQPILMKCSGGADRTSLASALFILFQAATEPSGRKPVEIVETAKRQIRFLPYLHLPKKHQRWIKYFIDFYVEDHANLSPLEWVHQRYRWEHFAKYMLDRGLAGYWAGPYPEQQ
ncbi:MAG: dual specificity protein phosphatase family protein [Gammaproteobacteria bacterium]|nr:dual specificity protein phosphatase family protein [Gammaproteobacteria bacterium]